jgi:calcineurin-like phosphoesterase family protein
MLDNWNEVVKPQDRVYHLGDFCMNRKCLALYKKLNGRITVVLGNHDPWKRRDYERFECDNIDHFQGVKMMPKLGWILSHVPVHPYLLNEDTRWNYNIHGHLHTHDVPDSRYFNVSVEKINYKPIELEELKARLECQKP